MFTNARKKLSKLFTKLAFALDRKELEQETWALRCGAAPALPSGRTKEIQSPVIPFTQRQQFFNSLIAQLQDYKFLLLDQKIDVARFMDDCAFDGEIFTGHVMKFFEVPEENHLSLIILAQPQKTRAHTLSDWKQDGPRYWRDKVNWPEGKPITEKDDVTTDETGHVLMIKCDRRDLIEITDGMGYGSYRRGQGRFEDTIYTWSENTYKSRSLPAPKPVSYSWGQQSQIRAVIRSWMIAHSHPEISAMAIAEEQEFQNETRRLTEATAEVDTIAADMVEPA